jgi:phage tail sheath protein FI
MATHVTYPGVYIREESSGAQAIAAAATSVALFVGMADRGAIDVPTRVLGQAEYERVFGATSRGEMADQLRQFYVNGGGEAWVMRIANGAQASQITIRQEGSNTAALQLTARDKGVAGDLIRVEVDYATSSPERSFNLTLYRQMLKSDGSYQRTEVETFTNLSMDSGAARYAPTLVNGASALVTITDPAPAAAVEGMSIGGGVWDGTLATARTNILDSITASANTFNISVNHKQPVKVVLPVGSAVFAEIQTRINNALSDAMLSERVAVDLRAFAGGSLLEIASINAAGPVVITPAAAQDVTVTLMLGVAAGGVEIDQSSARRPAPTGLASLAGPLTGDAAQALGRIAPFANALRNTVGNLRLTDPEDPAGQIDTSDPFLTGAGGDKFHAEPAPVGGRIGSLDNVRRAFDEMAAALGALSTARWSARRSGLRIVLTPKVGGPSAGAGAGVTSLGAFKIGNAANIFGTNAGNAAAYSLGAATLVGKQTAAVPGFDGTMPLLPNYSTAFDIIRSELDSFNFLILPRAELQSDADRQGLWGIASALAAERRALLLVDPSAAWTTIDAAEAGVAKLKVGVETRNSAIYWPRIKIPVAGVANGTAIDPSGSIAGLMARTDNRFGVWAAPAGLEATIRGIVGVERNMSDEENGVLNPLALNAIRLFPSGAVAWGARTMIGSDDTGNIDDKYIPVRRTMLFIEESLYRGLRFAVFRPNGEDLWSAIRLAAGSFMNTLMRQGAFASRNKLDAYYVLCDATTTTETDRNLGIVNVVVAFAPLKPAEFVILTVKQIAGQAQV